MNPLNRVELKVPPEGSVIRHGNIIQAKLSDCVAGDEDTFLVSSIDLRYNILVSLADGRRWNETNIYGMTMNELVNHQPGFKSARVIRGAEITIRKKEDE